MSRPTTETPATAPTSSAAPVERLRADAERRYHLGDVAGAAQRQAELLAACGEGASRGDHFLLVLYLGAAGDYAGVLEVLERAKLRWPEDAGIEHSIAATLVRKGDFEAAVPRLRAALAQAPDNSNLHDGLAHACGELGDMAGAREHGERSLTLKDAAAAPPPGARLREREVPPFAAGAPARNVIAYSLWGGNFRYLHTARRNAELAAALFPEWRCRFYVDDTVPDFVRGQLLAAGADVVLMPRPAALYAGLFWRFLPANEDGIDRFLCRDADSLLSLRERDAVMDWVDSGQAFHVMRDDHAHTDLVLAGMWGGVAGLLPSLPALWQPYLERKRRNANCDQRFLGEMVWPLIRDRVLVHDRVYRCFGARPFPGNVPTPAGWHVGANQVRVDDRPYGQLRAGGDHPPMPRRRRYLFTITSGRSGTAYLSRVLRANLDDAEVHHERTTPAYAFDWHTPDASHLTHFNQVGNLPEVRDFWRRKLGALMHGARGTYCELSHFLAKAGLVENLDLLGTDAEIHLLHLKRDLYDTAWSLANRFDFYNLGFTWLFYLDPRYARNLVPSEQFTRHGMLGTALWYVHEMNARGEYYRRRLESRPGIRFHVLDLAELNGGDGASGLLAALQPGRGNAPVKRPRKINATAQWTLGEREARQLRALVEGARVEYDAIVDYALQKRLLGDC